MTESMQGRLHTPPTMLAFILAGNARFTLKSTKTETRFTYKVKRAKEIEGIPTPFFVSLLTGSNNDVDYTFVGTLFPRTTDDSLYDFVFNKKCHSVKRDAKSIMAFEWFFGKIQADMPPPDLEVWHEGRCGACGRTLTVPSSIEKGIGPECELKMRMMDELENW